jgi:hypothetical protein
VDLGSGCSQPRKADHARRVTSTFMTSMSTQFPGGTANDLHRESRRGDGGALPARVGHCQSPGIHRAVEAGVAQVMGPLPSRRCPKSTAVYWPALLWAE